MSREYAKVIKFEDGVSIFIGSKNAALSTEFLKRNNIDLVINASNRKYVSAIPNIPTLRIKNFDDADVPVSDPNRIIEKSCSVANVIDHYASQGLAKNILIHCQMGINRSAFIIGSYLKYHRELEFDQIHQYLIQANDTRKTPVLTNPSFVQILKRVKN
jgi:predicted protein tyrosine phosphatase